MGKYVGEAIELIIKESFEKVDVKGDILLLKLRKQK
jgi:hypothetical protein